MILDQQLISINVWFHVNFLMQTYFNQFGVTPASVRFCPPTVYNRLNQLCPARGEITPPIPNVAPKMFWVIKLLMRKPKKYFSANQRHCLRNLLHLPLVEPDQSTVSPNVLVYTGVGKFYPGGCNRSFFQVKRRIFVGGGKKWWNFVCSTRN